MSSSLMIWLAASLTPLVAATDVFAHFMVQNSYAYTVSQWKTDMAAAQHTGIDGFALNWIPPDCQQPTLDWQVDRISDAFVAAEEMNFKLMHSFDMSYTECNIYWNQTFMADTLKENAGSKAAYRWNGNLLVSTYGGDQVDQYGNEFFEGLKGIMEGKDSISLAPALTTYSMQAATDPESAASGMIADYSSADGYLNWQAWPLDVHQNVTLTADRAFSSAMKQAGRKGPYIMTVSPWQYKDLNDGNTWDAWVQYSDYLFPDRFESITGSDAFQPDIIELLTWNDFPESHYLRDLPPQDDESATDYAVLGEFGNYIWGHDHAGWRRMARYYIHWMKTGKKPEITHDHVVYWYRVHPKDASCTGGASTPIRNSDFPADAVFAWALVKEPATISMSVGDNKYWTFQADASGPAMGMIPFPKELDASGATPEVSILRNGKLVHWSKGASPITDKCSYEDFNPVVGVCGG